MLWNMMYAVDFLSMAVFFWSYYFNCYRKGHRFDFWHAYLFIFCVLPYFAMLPLERNDLNAIIVGKDLAGVIEALPIVFAATVLGFFCAVLGRKTWTLRLDLGLRRSFAKILEAPPRCSMMILSSKSLLLFLSATCLCMQLAMLTLYFSHNGFGFDLRAYTFENPGARPIAQIVALSTVVVASHCLARYMDTKEGVLLGCTLLLTCGLIFFGQRTNIVIVYMNVTLCYLMKLGNRVSLWRSIGSILSVLMIFFYLGNVRDGLYSPADFLASLAEVVFFGNNFSDLRDFAWIYSHWNHELWAGRTYIAGLAAFVPRGLSGFRAAWTFGVATNLTVGIDTELHPGLKPGMFGECFFNFSWIGVAGVGLIYGILLRRVDLDVKAAFKSSSPAMRRAFASTTLVSIAAAFNTSLAFPFLYAFLGIYLLSWFYLGVRSLSKSHRTHASLLKLF